MNASSPPDVTASFQKLQEMIVLCRPGDVVAFALRFFKDEQLDTRAVAHAYHSIIYVVFQPDTFRSCACTIYSHELSQFSGTNNCLDGATTVKAMDKILCDDFTTARPIVNEVRNVRNDGSAS